MARHRERTAGRGLLARRWRLIVAVILGLILFSAVSIFGTGWYYADRLRDEALAVDHTPGGYDLLVVEVGPDSVTLEVAPGEEPASDWLTPGTYGLRWEEGYAWLKEIRDATAGQVTRGLQVFEGTLSPGTRARAERTAYPGDPLRVLGQPFEDVLIAGPLGAYPAWLIAAGGDDWAIFVHGHNGERREMLQAVPAFIGRGINALVISYRNDVGAPSDPDARHHFGAREWEDLDAAVAYAIDRGARRIVLMGNSMGGGIIMSLLYRSAQTGRVAGVVLDAPMLDFDATIDFRAPGGVPAPIIEAGKWLADVRFGVDWGALDYLRRADELNTPILLFHGTEDTSVPISTSEALVEARPDLVTFVRVEGARHVGSWNVDPAAYAGHIAEFLGLLLAR